MTDKKVQKRTIECREKLINAAWKLFCEKGYFNTNTKEITKEAGVSVGNFYNYYRDKSEIYYELTAQYLTGSTNAVKELEDVFKNTENKRMALKNYIYTQMDRATSTGRFFSDCQVLVQDDVRLKELFYQETDIVIKSITEVLQKIPGIKKRASFPVMARLLFTLIDNISEDACSPTNIDIYEEYREQMTEIVQNYVFGEEKKGDINGDKSN